MGPSQLLILEMCTVNTFILRRMTFEIHGVLICSVMSACVVLVSCQMATPQGGCEGASDSVVEGQTFKAGIRGTSFSQRQL